MLALARRPVRLSHKHGGVSARNLADLSISPLSTAQICTGLYGRYGPYVLLFLSMFTRGRWKTFLFRWFMMCVGGEMDGKIRLCSWVDGSSILHEGNTRKIAENKLSKIIHIQEIVPRVTFS